jgi:proliferating cell nuclear antigen
MLAYPGSTLVFVARTKSPEEWKAVTSAISTLVDEATFEATVEGIDIQWPNSTFDVYECDSSIKFGVRVDEFSKLIKRGDKKDQVEISVTDDSKLVIKLSNGYKREYRMRLIESSSSSTPLPKLNFNSKIVLTAGAFDKILSDIQVVSEYISLQTDSNKVNFSGKGDSGEAEIVLASGNEGLEDLTIKESSTATYSLDYLSKITKAIGTVGSSIAAEYSSKMPLRLEFRVASIGRIHFYLAPRVQD